MTIFGQSQKANRFQNLVTMWNDNGLASLRNLGIGAHPYTVKSTSLPFSTSRLEADEFHSWSN